MIEKIDKELQSTAQKFCDTFQQWTGLTKFFLEKWSLIGRTSMFSFLCFLLLSGENVPLLWSFFVYIIICVQVCATIFLASNIELGEAEFLRNGRLLFPSWRDYEDCDKQIRRTIWRICMLVASVPVFLLVNTTILDYLKYSALCTCIVLEIMQTYFSACIPKPPGKSKIRECLDSLSQTQSLIPSES